MRCWFTTGFSVGFLRFAFLLSPFLESSRRPLLASIGRMGFVTTLWYNCGLIGSKPFTEDVVVETVGIRELKTNLSRHLKRVRSGARLLVTEHGRSIATITPVDGPDVGWVTQLIADGIGQWSGGKPTGARNPVTVAGKRSASSVVIEDRR